MIKLTVVDDGMASVSMPRCASCATNGSETELAFIRAIPPAGPGRSSMLLCELCLRELRDKLTELLDG